MPDSNVNQMMIRFRGLQTSYQMRQISLEQYMAEVARLRVQDRAGVWWTVDPRTGGLLRFDGRQWVAAMQPSVASAAPPVVQPARAAPASSGGLRALLAASPILVLLPAVACGGLWFLYTFLGTFKGEGLRGVDFITPAIIVGVPLILWIFRKPIDALLKPLDAIIQPIPTALRYGIVLGLPVVLGCGCSLIQSSGYSSLNFTALVSTLAAAVLTRRG